jgi:hypothetical protein
MHGAVQLHGIVEFERFANDASGGWQIVAHRDVGALVSPAPYARLAPTPEAVSTHRGAVETAFAFGTILPAPFGTVFRSREVLSNWLDLHYVLLADALSYFENRCAARVRVSVASAANLATRPERITPLEISVFDSLNVLKRIAVAFIPQLADRPVSAQVAEAAFLLDREQWSTFSDKVNEEQKRHPTVAIEQSGPWPPYDFVRLQFRG